MKLFHYLVFFMNSSKILLQVDRDTPEVLRVSFKKVRLIHTYCTSIVVLFLSLSLAKQLHLFSSSLGFYLPTFCLTGLLLISFYVKSRSVIGMSTVKRN